MANGFILLPVLLSYFGPTADISSKNDPSNNKVLDKKEKEMSE